MITILRQKYEYLVTYMEARLADCEHGEKSRARHAYPDFFLYASEIKELQKQISEIRTIQKSLRIEDKT